MLFSGLPRFIHNRINRKMADWLVDYNPKISHHFLELRSPIQYLISGEPIHSWSYTLTPDQIDTLITVNRFGRGPKSDLTNDLARGAGTLTATDNGGDTAVSPGLVITVDTIPPVASPSITDVIETVGGTSLVLSGTVNNRRYLYRFEVVNVYDGDNLLGQAEVADNFRNWSFTDTTLAAGNLIYTAWSQTPPVTKAYPATPLP